MKVIAICNVPDGIKLDHAWFVAEDGLYAQRVAIRPMPEKDVIPPSVTSRKAEYGWIRCIEEILGEK